MKITTPTLAAVLCVITLMAFTMPAAAQLSWALRTPLIDPRTGSGVEGASASLIGNKIYVSHGYRFGDMAFLSIYDIPSDTWTHGGPTAPDAFVPRSEMAGGTASGRHYAIGGRTGPNADNEEFNPTTSTWTARQSMSIARGGLGAASSGDKIYAIGGRDGGTFGFGTIFELNEVYNPVTNTWTTLAPMPIPVSDNYATVAFDGRVYVFGGATDPSTVISTVQIYDIATNTWGFGTDMPTARAAAMAGVISNRIAVFGGFDPFIGNLVVTELYDPLTDTWSRGPDMLEPASEISQGVTYNGSAIYAIGTGIFGASGSVVQVLVTTEVIGCDGDVNLDGQVTPGDALIVFECFLDRRQCTEQEQHHGDITQDGRLTPVDALCVFREFLGLPPTEDCRCFLELDDLPDLVPLEARVGPGFHICPQVVCGNAPITVCGTISNQGSTSAPSTEVEIRLEAFPPECGTLVFEELIPTLAPGEEIDIVWRFCATWFHRGHLIVDPNNSVEESNEMNNMIDIDLDLMCSSL